jgi:hypothetical protein
LVTLMSAAVLGGGFFAMADGQSFSVNMSGINMA